MKIPLPYQIQVLRRERNAARREAGRLGEKLHTSRLEIIVLRYRVKELEDKQQSADAYKAEGGE